MTDDSIDRPRLARMQASVKSVLAGTDGKDPVTQAAGLVSAFNNVRSEIVAALPSELQDEFGRLFPELPTPSSRPSDLLGQAAAAGKARTQLSLLDGWLGAVLGPVA